MTEQREEQDRDPRAEPGDRRAWEELLRGFLTQADADQHELLDPPAAAAPVTRRRASR